MWYTTSTETQQAIPPGAARAGQQSDSPLDQIVAEPLSEKASQATAPGSEYWLP